MNVVICPETGKPQEYRHLMKGPDKPKWTRAMLNIKYKICYLYFLLVQRLGQVDILVLNQYYINLTFMRIHTKLIRYNPK